MNANEFFWVTDRQDLRKRVHSVIGRLPKSKEKTVTEKVSCMETTFTQIVFGHEMSKSEATAN